MATIEQHTITRDGQPPLRFEGAIIGSASSCRVDTRGTDITIYRTKGGRFVAQVERWTRWQGESGSDSAAAKDTLSELSEWLAEDNNGTLGRIAQEAIEEAIKKDPTLRDQFVEDVG